MDQNPRNPHLGINKLGKTIRKSPLHPQPTFQKLPPPPPQPQVYNISKNDFRSIVQQLTGSPARDPSSAPPPPHPKPPSSRLMKIRPPPLPLHNPTLNPNPNPTFSPVSAYMRYLETSLLSSDTSRPNPNPNPTFPAYMQPGILASPRSQFPLQSPNSLLPLQSPSAFLNLVSPKSPYLQYSPYSQNFRPNFAFAQMPQSGLLGPGPNSPNLLFPPSPSGFLPLLSPRWRE